MIEDAPWNVRGSSAQFDAYYYSFTPTGNEAVDDILRAVAYAGKMAHHTEEWSDSTSGYKSLVDWIQLAANEAAKKCH